MIRRINLFGAPCSGKTTMASEVFAKMKKKHKKVQLLIDSERKKDIYNGKVFQYPEQALIYSTKLITEIEALKHNDLIITDTPLHLINYYTFVAAKRAMGVSIKSWASCVSFFAYSDIFDSMYEPLNIFLTRNDDFPYTESGRLHSKDESAEIEKELMAILDSGKIPYTVIESGDLDAIMKLLQENKVV